MNGQGVKCSEPTPLLHHVQAGRGEAVLLLHGSASTGVLWRQAMETLQTLYRVIAPDLIGYGRSPAWPAEISYDVAAEVNALESLLPCCAGKYHLVGHSYGGVVALMLALAHPARLHSLTLIEPVFFSALLYAQQEAAYRRFCEVRDTFLSTLASGHSESAMREFIGFWAGDGAWERMPPAVRDAMVQMTGKIVLDWHASFTAEARWHDLATLGPRTLLLAGNHSPEPMRLLVDSLHTMMRGSTRVVIPGAGHLLPLTHTSEMMHAILGHFQIEPERRLP